VLAYLLARARRCTCAGQVELHVAVAGGGAQVQRLRLSVSDPGVGAAPARLARTVEPQAADGTRPGGLALGLAICRHLVQLMQGELLLSSVEGEGNLACLELELPVEMPLQPAPALRGRVALACTADPRTGHALAQALAALGLEPLEATPSGIGRVDRGDADLFLADATLVRAARLPAHARPACLLVAGRPLRPRNSCRPRPRAPAAWTVAMPTCSRPTRRWSVPGACRRMRARAACSIRTTRYPRRRAASCCRSHRCCGATWCPPATPRWDCRHRTPTARPSPRGRRSASSSPRTTRSTAR